jgi:hypothetical protein
MPDSIDFKQYWKNQPIDTPDPKEVIKKATQYKRTAFLKLVLANIILVATSIGIILVWYFFQPEYLSTKLGIICCIVAMVVYLAFYNSLAPLLLKNDIEMDSKAQLQQLLTLKEKQRFLQNILLNGYFILLGAGLGLYMYEYTSRMTLLWGICSYAIVAFWIAINAFYLGPKTIKKQQAKLNSLIAKLKEVNEQLIN